MRRRLVLLAPGRPWSARRGALVIVVGGAVEAGALRLEAGAMLWGGVRVRAADGRPALVRVLRRD